MARKVETRKRVPAIAEALAAAYKGMGGLDALTQWARDNPEKFYALWAKLQGVADAEKPVEVVHKIERTIVRPKDTDG